ncbi:uncharacterized protein LOC133303945 [Gastrolobium bilobum]|uniref:uncharacterized protein LOC133303945 n=1 Tax=Gastrolobium bilobum TaxID=150636 RepID=UPI002AB0539A|nr:uncharacterized protein LOC133303945 [Gastrolobium bilobum]
MDNPGEKMDNPGEKKNRALFIWRERRRMAIIHVICLVVYYYMLRIHSQSRIPDRMLILEKERAREKIMKRVTSSEGRKIIRMGPIAFLDLCAMLEREGGLQSTQRVNIEEQVAKTLYILTHNVRNREVQFWFRRSGETTSRHFHHVLRSIVELEDKYLKQPDGSQIPMEIMGSNQFNPFFKDCVGAIDCTHVRVKVPLNEASKYRGRKDFPTQNVLAACSFDLRFTYVLPGWEGTASDSRILKDALRRTDKLRIPKEPTYGIKTQNKIIIACCILHNYLMMVDPDEELVAEVDEEIFDQRVSEQHGDIHIDEDEDEEHTRLGENLRNSIADAMWRAYRS